MEGENHIPSFQLESGGGRRVYAEVGFSPLLCFFSFNVCTFPIHTLLTRPSQWITLDTGYSEHPIRVCITNLSVG